MRKLKTIDLFAGCGGLTEGFAQTGLYKTEACVEWETAQCNNLRKRLKEKWHLKNADERVIRFDVRRTDELINGFDDPVYGKSKGIRKLAGEKVDVIIGGPPCQAYSIAGRIRDGQGMKNDYRNYLFESYLEIVKEFQPKAFIFENVPGILSAKPGDRLIAEVICEEFSKAGYYILADLKNALINIEDYGVPQHRKRIIILGLSKEYYGDAAILKLDSFYNMILPSFKSNEKISLKDAIGDLPELIPQKEVSTCDGIKTMHSVPLPRVKNHICRYHNQRDIQLFEMLTKDIETGKNEFESVEKRKELYTLHTGRKSNIHKYNVLKWDQPSTTIPAHLCKDGLRHIHPDSRQARTITVREAARIQTFPDDYEFVGPMTDAYRMIGNAVPPEFARRLALALYQIID